jgi:hypothetical protein
MATLQLPTDNCLARSINAMHLEDRLGDVETDCRDRLHDLAPPNRGTSAGTHIHGTHVPVEEPSTASKADSCTAAMVTTAIAGNWKFSPAVGVGYC